MNAPDTKSKHIRAKVIKNQKETAQVSLLTLDISIGNALAGQFVMVWLAGEDEKPMSVANNSPLQIAVADAGLISNKLSHLKEGEYIFVRGPYGKPFEIVGKKLLMIGGGYGLAPIRFLANKANSQGCEVHCIIGARTKDYLMGAPKNTTNYFTTDDGSFGKKGTVLVELEQLLKSQKFDCIYCCGPEKMMYNVALMAKKYNVRSQLSVERYMKCGFGLCGHCAMGSWLSCVDGPTIDGEVALANPQFGKLACDESGKHVKL
jgi:dihydroorotate dehydrogenase electron transfer subunit